jgi:alkylated DNA nucleotide flippase Atl1
MLEMLFMVLFVCVAMATVVEEPAGAAGGAIPPAPTPAATPTPEATAGAVPEGELAPAPVELAAPDWLGAADEGPPAPPEPGVIEFPRERAPVREAAPERRVAPPAPEGGAESQYVAAVVEEMLPMLPNDTEQERQEVMRRRGLLAAGLERMVDERVERIAERASAELQSAREREQKATTEWNRVAQRADRVVNSIREQVFAVLPDLQVFSDCEEEDNFVVPLALEAMRAEGYGDVASIAGIRTPEAYRRLGQAIRERLERFAVPVARQYRAEGKQGTPRQAREARGTGRVSGVRATGTVAGGTGFREAPTPMHPTGTQQVPRDAALSEYDAEQGRFQRPK